MQLHVIQEIISETALSFTEVISVFNDGNFVNNTAEFEVKNQFSGELLLQCIGHAPSNIIDLSWVSQKTGDRPVELQAGMNNNQIQVSYAYNQANITIINSVEPYRGILRCQSRQTGQQATFYLVEESTLILNITLIIQSALCCTELYVMLTPVAT